MPNLHETEKLPFPDSEVRSLIARVAAKGSSYPTALTPEGVRSLVARGDGEVLAEGAGLDHGELDELLQGTPRVSRSRRRRLVSAVLVIAVAAAVALVAGLVLPPGKGGPSGAAAAQLHYLAKEAAGQPTPTLQPGQYYNQVWQESAQMSPSSPPGGSLPLPGTPNVYYLAKAQLATWVDSTGSGRCTFTPSGIAFISAADRAAWESEGRPGLGSTGISIGGQDAVPPNLEGTNALYLCPNSPSSTNAQIGTSGEWVENGAPLQLFNVSGLPTDPASLGTLITQRQTGIEAIDSEPAGEFNTFAAVVQLLSGPDLGVTPAFRSALYQVLAGLPGVTVTDSVTDAYGRTGVEIALPTSYPFFLVTGSFVEKAIVDPATTDVLDWSVDDVGPSTNTTTSAYGWAITYEPGTVYSFSLVSSGIVDSDSATVSG
jgi:hypothetical protein